MASKVLGIDVGTTAIKAIVLEAVSPDHAEILSVKSLPHELVSGRAGWAEEDALVWKDHLIKLLASMDTDGIKAIGLTGMVPALVMLDKDNEPVRFSIQQNDMRTGEEIAYLRTLLETDGSYFAKTGSHVNSQHIAPRLLWLKHNEKENFSRMRHILGSYDWIGFILTGRLHVERNWALESGMYSFSGEWMPEVLSSAGISQECLPPVACYDEVLGTVTEEIAHLTGLPAGIPVYAGTADHVASAYCSGAREHGDLVLKLGGAGDVLLSLDHLVTDDRLYIDYFCSKACPYVLNGCTAASGSLLKWFSREFGGDFKTLDIEASSVPPGSDGLVMLPYVLGEKTPVFDTEARGVLYGLTLSHTKAHVYRALLEATAYAFRHHIDVIRECGVEVNDVYITNGGSTSPLWRQIMADITGFPVAYIKTNPGSCLGAAFIAGIASGFLTEDVIEDFTSQRIYSYPDERTFQSYDRGYFIYRSLYPRLKPLFHS